MTEPNNEALARVAEAIRQRHRFFVTTHVKPDGDAAGSLLGLTFMLRGLGKTVEPHTQDPIPSSYDFLAGSNAVSQELPQPDRFDAAILVDCGELDRVGASFAQMMGNFPFLINIDHHYGNAPFGDVSWVNPTASSTCEMLYELCAALPVKLDAEIATHLYTGLVTDTGSFRFGNTNQKVLEIAADLVAAGAQPAYIAQQIYDSAPPQRLQLLARALATIAFYDNARLATGEITMQMFEATGTIPTDGDGFINHLRSVKSVEMAMLFREDPDGLIHVSMRSKGKVDVATFAQNFGGGGHRQAAAFRAAGPMDAVRTRFTKEALRYVQRPSAQQPA